MPDVFCKGLNSIGLEDVTHFLVDQENSDIVCTEDKCSIDAVSERVFDKRDNGKGYEIKVKEERAFDFVGWYTISAETCPEPEKAEGEKADGEEADGEAEGDSGKDECAVDADEDAGEGEVATVCGAGTSTKV